MLIRQYIAPTSAFPFGEDSPWETIAHLEEIVCCILQHLDADYIIDGGVAVHRSATVADDADDAVIHAPAIISEGCYVGSHSVLRGAVFLAPGARVGNCCEVKTSVVLEDSAIAHFNFVGDSIIGRNVNIEAGAILANHYNERSDDTVYVHQDGLRISTGLHKFGSLVGDGCRIGANAVLSPGTLLKPMTIVHRLQLIEQDPQ